MIIKMKTTIIIIIIPIINDYKNSAYKIFKTITTIVHNFDTSNKYNMIKDLLHVLHR